MAKKKGLKNALVRQQARQDEKTRTENYEKRQADQLKAKGKGNASRATGKGKGKAASRSSESKMVYQPYRVGESVLFVGEGDFSFAVSWASKYPESARLSFATSYDSEEDAKRKYQGVVENIERLQRAGMTVLFNVDAQNLASTKVLKKRPEKEATRFDKVVFNFPHVGAGEKDEARNVKLNQILLLRFLRSVQPFLKETTSQGGKMLRRGLDRGKPKQTSIDELGVAVAEGDTSMEEEYGQEELSSDPEDPDSEDDGVARTSQTAIPDLWQRVASRLARSSYRSQNPRTRRPRNQDTRSIEVSISKRATGLATSIGGL